MSKSLIFDMSVQDFINLPAGEIHGDNGEQHNSVKSLLNDNLDCNLIFLTKTGEQNEN